MNRKRISIIFIAVVALVAIFFPAEAFANRRHQGQGQGQGRQVQQFRQGRQHGMFHPQRQQQWGGGRQMARPQRQQQFGGSRNQGFRQDRQGGGLRQDHRQFQQPSSSGGSSRGLATPRHKNSLISPIARGGSGNKEPQRVERRGRSAGDDNPSSSRRTYSSPQSSSRDYSRRSSSGDDNPRRSYGGSDDRYYGGSEDNAGPGRYSTSPSYKYSSGSDDYGYGGYGDDREPINDYKGPPTSKNVQIYKRNDQRNVGNTTIKQKNVGNRTTVIKNDDHSRNTTVINRGGGHGHHDDDSTAFNVNFGLDFQGAASSAPYYPQAAPVNYDYGQGQAFVPSCPEGEEYYVKQRQ